jgi:hypothetical protein
MSDAETLGLLAVGGTVFLLTMLTGLILYLVYSFGLYKMAQKQGLENSWLAFVPIIQLYTLGKVIGELKILSYKIPQPEFVLPGSTIISIVLSQVPVIGLLINLAVIVLYVAAFYELYKKYKPASAVLYTVISFVIPFTLPFFVFSLRNEAPAAVE